MKNAIDYPAEKVGSVHGRLHVTSFQGCRTIYRLFRIPGLAYGLRQFHASVIDSQVDQSYQFVVCGAGAGGLAMASILGRRFGPDKLAIIDPAEVRKAHSLFQIHLQ